MPKVDCIKDCQAIAECWTEILHGLSSM
jgi:hypothetical protein